MIVYYSNSMTMHYPPAVDIPLENAADDLRKNYDLEYLKCPAGNNFFKNLYVVRNPFDIEYYYEGNDLKIRNIPEHIKDLFAHQSVLETQLPHVRHLFFSESPVSIITLPPFAHDSIVNNYKFLPGTFDISKWFRPVQCSFIDEEKKSLFIKRGEALQYVLFNTSEKVKLKPYETTEKIAEYTQRCSRVKYFVPGKNLNFLYNLFVKQRLNKKIIQEIKDNLI